MRRFGPRSDQPVQVAGLELVRIGRQRRQVTDSVPAAAGREGCGRGERPQRGVSTRAAASNHYSVDVRAPAGGHLPGARDAVRHVQNAPLALQSLHVGATVAAAAGVVHVEHGKPAGGPELHARAETARRERGRTTVTHHDQRRHRLRHRRRPRTLGVRVRRVIRVRRCIEPAVHLARLARPGHRLRVAHPLGVERPGRRGPDQPPPARGQFDDLGRHIGELGQQHDAVAGGVQAVALDHLCRQPEVFTVAQQHGTAAAVQPGPDHDVPCFGECERPTSENPERLHQVSIEMGDLRHRPVRPPAVQLGEPAAIRAEQQVVTPPHRVHRGLFGPARHVLGSGSNKPVQVETPGHDRAGIPRHGRMPPLHPGQHSGRAEFWAGVEVGARDQYRPALAVLTVQAQGHQGVHRFTWPGVVLPDGEYQPGRRKHPKVSEAPASSGRGESHRLVGVQPQKLSFGIRADHHDTVAGVPGAAAVLVHPGAHAEAGSDLGHLTAPVAHQGDPSPFGGPRLRPVQVVTVVARFAEPDAGLRQQPGVEWGFPGAVSSFRHGDHRSQRSGSGVGVKPTMLRSSNHRA